MFRQSLFAIALVASLAFCGRARALDQVNVPDSYSVANTVPTSEVDSGPADIVDVDKPVASAHGTTSVAVPQDDSSDSTPAVNTPQTDSEPAESAGPAHAHKNPAASAHAAAHAKAHKNHAAVRWQSLLPGVMK